MQQAPGQQAPPAQQPSSPDEIVVAAVSTIIAAIKSRYFINPPLRLRESRLRELAPNLCVFCAEPIAVRENRSAAAESAAVRFVQKQ